MGDWQSLRLIGNSCKGQGKFLTAEYPGGQRMTGFEELLWNVKQALGVAALGTG